MIYFYKNLKNVFNANYGHSFNFKNNIKILFLNKIYYNKSKVIIMKKFGRRITSSLFFTILFSIAEIALIIWALYGLRELISDILTALAMEISDTAVYYSTRIFFSLVELVFFLIASNRFPSSILSFMFFPPEFIIIRHWF